MDYLRFLSLEEACRTECILVVDKNDVNVFIQNTKNIISRMKTISLVSFKVKQKVPIG